MKKNENITPPVWEIETLNDTGLTFSMKSDDPAAPSILVVTVQKGKQKIIVEIEANEADKMRWGINSCIPPSAKRNNAEKQTKNE